MATLGVTLYNQELYMKCNISLVFFRYVLYTDNTVVLWICSVYCDKKQFEDHTHTHTEIFLTTVAECMQHRESASLFGCNLQPSSCTAWSCSLVLPMLFDFCLFKTHTWVILLVQPKSEFIHLHFTTFGYTGEVFFQPMLLFSHEALNLSWHTVGKLWEG